MSADEARQTSQDRYRQEQQRHEETQNERNKYKVPASQLHVLKLKIPLIWAWHCMC